MNSNTADTLQQTIDIVDDVELLAILGLTSPPRSPCDTTSFVVLDWDDMPELSVSEEDEEEDDNVSVNNKKRKYEEDEEEDEDIFAQFDFVEVSPIENKKQKTLLIQQPFSVAEEQQEEQQPTFLQSTDEQDIKLALDLIISSATTTTA